MRSICSIQQSATPPATRSDPVFFYFCNDYALKIKQEGLTSLLEGSFLTNFLHIIHFLYGFPMIMSKEVH